MHGLVTCSSCKPLLLPKNIAEAVWNEQNPKTTMIRGPQLYGYGDLGENAWALLGIMCVQAHHIAL